MVVSDGVTVSVPLQSIGTEPGSSTHVSASVLVQDRSTFSLAIISVLSAARLITGGGYPRFTVTEPVELPKGPSVVRV